jgi:hypothetical protein
MTQYEAVFDPATSLVTLSKVGSVTQEAMRDAIIADPQTLEIKFINKTKQLWAQFTMLQFDFPPSAGMTGPTGTILSPDLLNLQPVLNPQAGSGSINWNTVKEMSLTVESGKYMRFIGLFPLDDPNHPLGGVMNLTPLLPIAGGPTTYEIRLDKCKTQLLITPKKICNNTKRLYRDKYLEEY